ncbi:MAG: substrate-binding domain-containing protein [Gemmatimonadales bacterium]
MPNIRLTHYTSPVALLVLLAVGMPPRAAVPQAEDIVLATTTSIRDAGLLDALLPAFERKTGYAVKVIAVGSGQAMELGRRGEASILIVHDSAGEQRFMDQGFGTTREPLMHDEFVLVGPRTDPAGVRGLRIHDAMRAIGNTGSLFVSRSDRSGTDVKEKQLWHDSRVSPTRIWIRESGQGMSPTLQISSELQAYTLTDVGTLLMHRSPLELEILVRGDPVLENPYHVILINQRRFPWINSAGAKSLMDYLLSPDVQQLIGEFGREVDGRSLFVPGAR